MSTPHGLSRCCAVAIGKGGVGKTSLTANIGAELARTGWKVLLVSLDPQDNLGEDLGYANAGDSDEGANLAAAIRDKNPLQPLRDVRENLDVICGGDALEDLVADLYVTRHQGDNNFHYSLAAALTPLKDNYDIIIIDCPPGYHILQHLALVAARWILVPTAPDASSRKGISRLAARVQEASHHNPDVALLGVVLFNVPPSAAKLRQTTAQAVADDLGTPDYLLTGTIRTAVSAAAGGRDRGQVMHELAQARQAPGSAWKERREIARSVDNLTADYTALATEIRTRLKEQA